MNADDGSFFLSASICVNPRFHLLRNEISADFPDVSRAHRHYQITFADVAAEVIEDLVELRQMQRAVAVRVDFSYQVITADQMPLGLGVADEIDVRDDRLIGGG